jgi:hypothetical protein
LTGGSAVAPPRARASQRDVIARPPRREAVPALVVPALGQLEASKEEHQVDDHLAMQDGWLRGDLVIEVAPDAKFVIGLRMCTTKDGTHDVGLAKESSYTAIVDPPDEKERAAARKKLFECIFSCLELEVRQSVALPAG